MVQLSHPYMTTEKTKALTRWIFVGKVMSLYFNVLSRFVITFLPRSNLLFNFMAAITIDSNVGSQENKVCHSFHCFPIYFPWSDAMILVFECWDLSHLNLTLLFQFHQVALYFLFAFWCHLHICSHWYFPWQSWSHLALHPIQNFTWCILQRS